MAQTPRLKRKSNAWKGISIVGIWAATTAIIFFNPGAAVVVVLCAVVATGAVAGTE